MNNIINIERDKNMNTKQNDRLKIDEAYEKLIMKQSYPLDKPQSDIIKNFRDSHGKHESPVVNVPIDLLRYRIENGRIARDVMSKRKKDPSFFEEDKESVKEFIEERLMEKDSKINDNLKKSIFGGEQDEPAVITCDGYVIDGNRRLAIINQLYKETSDQKYTTMKCMILPGNEEYADEKKRNDKGDTPTKKEISLLEIYFQMSEQAKAEYKDFDMVLSRRNYKDEGISFKDQVEADNKYSRATKKEKDTAIKNMEFDDECLNSAEEYLIFIGQEGLFEHIADDEQDTVTWKTITYYYQKLWQRVKTEEGCLKHDIDPNNRTDIKKAAFNMIREGDLAMKGSVYKKMDYFLKFWQANDCIKIMKQKVSSINGKLEPEDIGDTQDFEDVNEKWKEKYSINGK